jgi:hypothetical protein
MRKTLAPLLVGTALAVAGPLAAQPASGGPSPGGFPGMPNMADTQYTAAIDVRAGALAGPAAHGAQAAVLGATEIRDVALTSTQDALNGVIVSGGQSAVTMRGGSIALSGAGTNDFLGTGAGVLVNGGATLVLDGTRIETSGRISSAAVAAEGARLRVYNARLVANGGPLPEGYVPRIGPGMMEPPAPLGLEGTARTVLAMSNSDTLIVSSHIEADGWGAVSTDATGGDLYLKVVGSTILVRRRGYGTYADFGAHVVVESTRIDSGGHMGIIAGKARTDFTGVSGRAAGSVMMIHSVMAFDPAETADFTLIDAAVSSGEAAILVKSANANLTIAGGSIASDSGVLLEVRKNDDPNATQTGGSAVPGVTLRIERAQLAGDVIDTDPDRPTSVLLDHATLAGALGDVSLSIGEGGRWVADADSDVALVDLAASAQIDALPGVTIRARGAGLSPRILASGGRLVVVGE